MLYPIKMLLSGFTLLLAFHFGTSSTASTTSKEIKCNSCTPVTYPSPPPPSVIECPPPPSPPSPPPPSPTRPPAPAPAPSPPPPACSGCSPPCSQCPPVPCVVCPPTPRGQPGVTGGAVYSPPNEVVPYFPYSFQKPPLSESTASSTNLELKLVISIIFLLLSVTVSLF
ncbi:hypothetical protein DITRI_Ditri13aG0073300 [Diplodiscus trichospermus]